MLKVTEEGIVYDWSTLVEDDNEMAGEWALVMAETQTPNEMYESGAAMERDDVVGLLVEASQ